MGNAVMKDKHAWISNRTASHERLIASSTVVSNNLAYEWSSDKQVL